MGVQLGKERAASLRRVFNNPLGTFCGKLRFLVRCHWRDVVVKEPADRCGREARSIASAL
jgi:hypothetical protein